MDIAMSLEQPVRPPRRSFHSFNIGGIGGTTFEVETRYVNLRAVGQGSYGFVCSADDVVTGNKVAIKKVSDMFADLVDAKRILREIKLLKHLGDHENVIGLVDISVMPPHTLDFKDIYIVTELFECDLDRIVSSSQPLSDQHAQYFLYQILRGIKYVHSANVLHRDLKPSNLLVKSNCDLAICDFGLARGVNTEYEDTLTEYVVTRWYRAPELLTDSKYYGSGVDVWSIGCIFGEILARRPILQGRDYMHQLQVIIEVLGTPSASDMDFITNPSARRAIQAFGRHRKRSLIKMSQFHGCNPLAIDLLQRMLVFDPRGRITIDEALEHPYLADLHDETEVPVASSMFDLRFEQGYKAEMPKDVMQRLIFEDMVAYHPEETFYTAQNSARSDASSSSRSSSSSLPVSSGPASHQYHQNFPRVSHAGRQRATGAAQAHK
ncbi:Mitogen-activated protein kinase 1 [Hondaea fermentalgiana]|uniref:Mitogen-activated protein kinase n=1 Tax=Hondaea fermentalgiana TaxID=2315210 RepID=A0A2R5G442_9STRA|nr:Mitogen-activated protein kinase 1 [Hondaea fermentalgiana]|eukprot:GBG24548.1 Mitogen-activated protein kinase 1 [Hondaea fermentalgiana]